MNTWRRTAALVLVAGLVATVANAKNVSDGFSAKTKIVARIDVTGLKQVPVIDEILQNEIAKVDAFFEQLRLWVGVDLNTVHTVWLGVEGEDQAVIVLKGRFDPELVHAAVTKIPQMQIVQRQLVPVAVMMPDDKKPGKFNLAALLNPTTLALGPPALCDRYIAAFTGKAAGLPEAARPYLAEMEKSPALAHALVLGFEKKALTDAPFLMHLKQGVLKVNFQEKALLDFRIQVTDAEMLAPLQQLASGFLGVFRRLDPSARGDNAVLQVIADNAAAKVVGDELVLTSTADEALLRKLLRQVIYKGADPAGN